ncbi:hypothetical protein [Streptomyces sp. NPDC020965]|uniref:hypothetical protein n=1 Tax=Streptomyces sp. NPDC020965 TaxID=3365105 RepID=UPI0037872660
MNLRNRVCIGAVSAAFVGGSLVLPPAAHAGEFAPASCYGSASAYSKPAGTTSHPAGRTFITSNACSDINIKPKSDRHIMVCIERNGAQECPASYTAVKKDTWTVLRSNVPDDTQFAFYFRSDALSNGHWAA